MTFACFVSALRAIRSAIFVAPPDLRDHVDQRAETGSVLFWLQLVEAFGNVSLKGPEHAPVEDGEVVGVGRVAILFVVRRFGGWVDPNTTGFERLDDRLAVIHTGTIEHRDTRACSLHE